MPAEVIATGGSVAEEGLIWWNGKAVVTLAQVDRLHEKAKGTSKKTFGRLKKAGRVSDGRDFFSVQASRLKAQGQGWGQSVPNLKFAGNKVTLLTERGYFLVIKTFEDERAFDIYEQMMDSHFRARQDTLAPFVQDLLLDWNDAPADADRFYAVYARSMIDALARTPGAPILGVVVMEFIYKMMLPGERLYNEVDTRNQKMSNGRRKHLHYQFITEIGKAQVLGRCGEIAAMLYALDYDWARFVEKYRERYGAQKLAMEFEASDKRIKSGAPPALQLVIDFDANAVAETANAR